VDQLEAAIQIQRRHLARFIFRFYALFASTHMDWSLNEAYVAERGADGVPTRGAQLWRVAFSHLTASRL